MRHDNIRRTGHCRLALATLAVSGIVMVLLQLRATKQESADQETAHRAPLIEGFELRDFRGRKWSLADFDQSRLLVVAFLGTECPLARRYAVALAELDQHYPDRQVGFLGVASNRQDSLTEMAQFARDLHIKFPLLKDLNNRVADRFRAQRTPEVFVLDERRVVRYRGRIDDRYHYGLARAEAEHEFLEAALTELLAGQPVSTPSTEAVGCLIGRARSPDETAEVTYCNQISRILQQRCVTCHRKGEIAPFALTEYEEVAGWAEMIAEVVRDQRMPPWHANPEYGTFRNDPRLSNEDRELIYRWAAAGAPKGKPSDLPDPPAFVDGWQIGTPDQVIYMADEPFLVPAEGEIDYQYFVVDPGWTDDKWIQAAECRPGNRAVVHHIDVMARSGHTVPAGSIPNVAGTSPGEPPQVFPAGLARHVPANSKLVFEIHYTANGSPQSDRSCIGVIFADPEKVQHRVNSYWAYNEHLCVPPGAADHKVEASYTLQRESLLLNMSPHMHLRGKSFRFSAVYPDGRQETLLDVPRWDFNWQHTYELAEPKLLPAGTSIHCEAHYDNSDNNLANPDPSKTVRWGAQIWDEMMSGYFDVVATEPCDATALGPGTQGLAR